MPDTLSTPLAEALVKVKLVYDKGDIGSQTKNLLNDLQVGKQAQSRIKKGMDETATTAKEGVKKVVGETDELGKGVTKSSDEATKRLEKAGKSQITILRSQARSWFAISNLFRKSAEALKLAIAPVALVAGLGVRKYMQTTEAGGRALRFEVFQLTKTWNQFLARVGDVIYKSGMLTKVFTALKNILNGLTKEKIERILNLAKWGALLFIVLKMSSLFASWVGFILRAYGAMKYLTVASTALNASLAAGNIIAGARGVAGVAGVTGVGAAGVAGSVVRDAAKKAARKEAMRKAGEIGAGTIVGTGAGAGFMSLMWLKSLKDSLRITPKEFERINKSLKKVNITGYASQSEMFRHALEVALLKIEHPNVKKRYVEIPKGTRTFVDYSAKVPETQPTATSSKIVNTTFNAISSLLNKLTNAFKPIGSAFISGFKGVLAQLISERRLFWLEINTLRKSILYFSNKLSSGIASWNKSFGIGRKLKPEAITDKGFNTILSSIGDLLQGIRNKLSKAFSKINVWKGDIGKLDAEKISRGIDKGFGTSRGVISRGFNAIISSMGDLLQGIRNKLSKTFSKIDVWKGNVNTAKITKGIDKVFETSKGVISRGFNSIISSIADLLQGIKNKLNKVLFKVDIQKGAGKLDEGKISKGIGKTLEPATEKGFKPGKFPKIEHLVPVQLESLIKSLGPFAKTLSRALTFFKDIGMFFGKLMDIVVLPLAVLTGVLRGLNVVQKGKEISSLFDATMWLFKHIYEGILNLADMLSLPIQALTAASEILTRFAKGIVDIIKGADFKTIMKNLQDKNISILTALAGSLTHILKKVTDFRLKAMLTPLLIGHMSPILAKLRDWWIKKFPEKEEEEKKYQFEPKSITTTSFAGLVGAAQEMATQSLLEIGREQLKVQEEIRDGIYNLGSSREGTTMRMARYRREGRGSNTGTEEPSSNSPFSNSPLDISNIVTGVNANKVYNVTM